MDTSTKLSLVCIVFIGQSINNLIVLSGRVSRVTPRRAVVKEPFSFPTGKPQIDFYAIDFEVEGRVQGKDIMFKECLKQKIEELGNVRGYVFDTPYGTVRGHFQTTELNILLLKHWLRYIGSPMSLTEHSQFKNHLKMRNYTMSNNFFVFD